MITRYERYCSPSHVLRAVRLIVATKKNQFETPELGARRRRRRIQSPNSHQSTLYRLDLSVSVKHRPRESLILNLELLDAVRVNRFRPFILLSDQVAVVAVHARPPRHVEHTQDAVQKRRCRLERVTPQTRGRRYPVAQAEARHSTVQEAQHQRHRPARRHRRE